MTASRRLRVATTALALASVTAAFGPLPPTNPHLGPMGTATMHGDAESSDSTPLPGPGAGGIHADFTELGAACPTILQGADGYPQALCTKITNRAPIVVLLDPGTGRPLATLELTSGTLLAGVYAYLDEQDRLVTVAGGGALLRVTHDRGGALGGWRLFVDTTTDLGHSDVSAVMPDQAGRVWFATDSGGAGFLDPATRGSRSIRLGAGERVANSLSTAPAGAAIATDHALYLLDVDATGAPHIRWRREYDRGPARKPGQLSHGTGATPTFFGPHSGTEYLAITDNAAPKENLLVFDAATGYPVCSVPAVDGTENSPIGSGSAVIVASTYGYPYPALPAQAGPSVPPSAPFVGGMTRVDVSGAGTGCTVVWTNTAPSAAVPRLSVSDRKIYTVIRKQTPGLGGVADTYWHTVIDADTGRVDAEHLLGATPLQDTLQTVGTIAPGRIQYQGTLSGLFRIRPTP